MSVGMVEENIGCYFIPDVLAEHQIAGYCDSHVYRVGESVGYIDRFGVACGMSLRMNIRLAMLHTSGCTGKS